MHHGSTTAAPRSTLQQPSRALLEQAEALARGPHPCPGCEHPLWSDPPVPWTGLRDYVVRCECCMRPVQVRIDRNALHPGLHAASTVVHPDHGRSGEGTGGVDLLTRSGQSGFRRRLLAAAAVVGAVLLVALVAGLAPFAAGILATASIVPAALLGPTLAATLLAADSRARRMLARRPTIPGAPVSVHAARWDQWLREVRVRRAERDSDALLEELGRHVDPRELARIHRLISSGAVPASHLDDLVHFRRSFAARHGLAGHGAGTRRRPGAA